MEGGFGEFRRERDRESLKSQSNPNLKKALIRYPPQAECDNAKPIVTYRTARLYKNKYKDRIKKPPPPSSVSESTLFDGKDSTSSAALSSIHNLTGTSKYLEVQNNRKYLIQSKDPIQDFITVQRCEMGLETIPTRYPDMSEYDRPSLVATSASTTGIRALQQLSKKLLSLPYEEWRDEKEDKVDATDFVYALRREYGALHRTNPYDLIIVSPETARKMDTYYTISAISVAEIRKMGGLDPVHVLRWLWERDIYHKLISIPFFSKFQVWRIFTRWKKWIRWQKFITNKKLIQKNLIFGDSILLRAVGEVQELCGSACSFALDEGIALEKEISLHCLDMKRTYILSDFMSIQAEACDVAKYKLAFLREHIIQVVHKTLTLFAKQEGMFEFIEEDGEEPSCIRVLECRIILNKLKRFEHMCSSIIVDMLHRLVMKSVIYLEKVMRRNLKVAVSSVDNLAKDFSKMQGEITSQPFTKDVMDRLELPVPEDTDLIAMQATSFSALLSTTDLDIEFSMTDMVSETPKYAQVRTTDNLTAIAELLRKPADPVLPLWEVQFELFLDTKLPAVWENDTPTLEPDPVTSVKVVPSAGDFKESLTQLFKLYDDVVLSFYPLSCDERIKPFLGCSKFDYMMLTEDQEKHQEASEWPDVENLLHKYTPYERCVTYIENLVSTTMIDLLKLSANYFCYGEMVNDCRCTNIPESVRVNDWSVATFQRAFALYHDQVYAMEKMMTSFQVGVAEVKAKEFRKHCLSFPKKVLSELEAELPRLASEKAADLGTDIKHNIEKMLAVPVDVEGFVTFLSNVESIENDLPDMEKRLTTLTSFYNVAQQFKVEIVVEEMANYKAIFPQFRQLKSALLQAQVTKSEGVSIFSSTLRNEMVELLHRAREIRDCAESQALLKESMELSSTKALQELTILKDDLQILLMKAKRYVDYNQVFTQIPTSKRYFQSTDTTSHSWTPEEVYNEVIIVEQCLEMRETLFQTKAEWDVKRDKWLYSPIISLDFPTVKRELKGFIKTIDFLDKSLPTASKLTQFLNEDMLKLQSWLPTVSCLLNPALKFRHWDSINEKINTPLKLKKELDVSVNDLKEGRIFDHRASIVTISNQANHEETLENMLKKVSNEWTFKEFNLVPYRGVSGRPTYILGGAQDLFASLEDSLTVLSIIKSSRYVGPIKHSVVDWENRLILALETVEYWMFCQKNWLYLESIFSATEIQRQLIAETKIFLQADKSWRDVIRIIVEKVTALKAVSTAGVLEFFQSCNVLLEQVFKGLEDYLEEKRLVFPRLNFISNSELLDIISHTKDISRVQPYLNKLFGNIKRLKFAGTTTSCPPIIGMLSIEGERIKIRRACGTRGSPEKWLGHFESVMAGTVKDFIETCMSSYTEDGRQEWLITHPGQAILTVTRIQWTYQVELCLHGENPLVQLADLHEFHVETLKGAGALLSSMGTSSAKRSTVSSLLTLDIHGRDVMKALLTKKVTSSRDFEWIRHLRYYWENGTCLLRQCCAEFKYANEYIGCLPRLVVTPLSERCYLTLTTAFDLHLGGSPIGPAGTGKSETVKDLAKAMGQLCLVINASEGLDYKMMGRYFSGLCQTGIWLCFDEFNRMNVEVLSVVAQQLQCIKTAKDKLLTNFIFEGRSIKLKPHCAVCITMNPGYAGRVELPDNLKPHFRPVAMMVPDTNLIAEVLLFTNCFATASTLGLKLTTFYSMMQALISSQHHYDFGLRSVKAVISLAGEYLKDRKKSIPTDDQATTEKQALVTALKDATIPRLVAKDVATVRMLLWDLFHSTEKRVEDINHIKLNSYIKEAFKENSLEFSPSQVSKCHELYNTLLVRHGVMLLGPTGGGKTSVIKLLRTALATCHRDFYGLKSYEGISDLPGGVISSFSQAVANKTDHCQLEIINPKSVSMGRLYGYNDTFTLEWKNGILAKVLLTYSNQTESELFYKEKKEILQSTDERSSVMSSHISTSSSTDTLVTPSEKTEVFESNLGFPYPPSVPTGWRWVLLDGPIDSEWIENLNSVLDDSKVLCLENGERIRLLPGSRVLFESDSLTNASPATVSRCGVIFLDPGELGWKPVVLSWIRTLPENLPNNCKEHILDLFELSMDSGLDFLKQHASELVCPVPGISAIKSLCYIIDGFLKTIEKDYGGFTIKESSSQGGKSEGNSVSNMLQLPRRTSQRQSIAGLYIPGRSTSNVNLMTSSELVVPKKPQIPYHRQHPEALCELVSNVFVFAYTWALGGCFENLEDEGATGDDMDIQKLTRGGNTAREQFDALVYDIFIKRRQVARLPTSPQLIFSYYVDIFNNTFEPWSRLISSPKQNASFLSTDIPCSYLSPRSLFKIYTNREEDEHYSAADLSMIPTDNTIRLSFLISILFQSKATPHILITGKSGVGKTQYLSYLSQVLSVAWKKDVNASIFGNSPLQSSRNNSMVALGTSATDRDEDSYTVLLHHVSTLTGSQQLQSMLEKHLVRQGKSLLGPSSDNNLVVLLDDLHVASSDDYGCKPSMELLRQLISGGGWYDTKMLLWKNVTGITFVGSHSTNGAASTSESISQRLLSKFHLLYLPEPTSKSLLTIYSSHILNAFSRNKFPLIVTEAIDKLTACAIFILQEVRTQLTPTPMKPQYSFCLKDLSKVFTGLLRVGRRDLDTRDDCIHLLVNEMARVFYDRCFPEDRDKILNIFHEGLRIYFKIVRSNTELRDQLLEVSYTGFLDKLATYSPTKSSKKLVDFMERMQDQQNKCEDTTSNLVFFPLACEHIIRLARVFQLSKGHVMLIGLGGVGRRSCVKLASLIANLKYHILTPIHRETPFSDLLEELKGIIRQCGTFKQPSVVLATDNTAGGHQDAFFGILNELVVGGQVMELFDKEEEETLLDLLSDELRKGKPEGHSLTIAELREMFIKRVFDNLHVVLCFTPSSTPLAEVCKKFPTLVTHMTVDVFDEWPPKALYGVALKKLHSDEVTTTRSRHLFKNIQSQIASVFVKIHGTVLSAVQKATANMSQLIFVVTPSSFIHFIQTFIHILAQQHNQVLTKKDRLELGMKQLKEADNRVIVMKSELQILQPQVIEKAEEVEALIVKLDAEQKEVDALRATVAQERKDIAAESDHVAALAKEAEEDLQTVLPILQAAERDLNALKKSDLTEIRSYGTPPTMVMNVMGAVCVLLQEPTDWNNIKRVMASLTFLKSLTTYDTDKVTDKILQKLRRYTTDPNFVPEKMAKFSLACMSFCKWVLAVEHYTKVYSVMKPKRELHKKLAKELEDVVAVLEEKEAQLQELEIKLADLEERCTQKKQERDVLQEKCKEIECKLNRAETLTQSLEEEQTRWTETLTNLERKTTSLLGDALLSACCLSYFGPFTPSLRHSLLAKWKHLCHDAKITCDPSFSMEEAMGDSKKIQEWYVQGLPEDSQSVQNALLLTMSDKCPFVIDPQGQAAKWLKAKLVGSHLMVKDYGGAKLIQSLEHAVMAGLPLMITGVPEHLSSVLDPFMEKNAPDEAGQKRFIVVGKNEIEYNPSFRLFLMSSKSGANLPSDTCTKTTVINFSATLEGYQDQLLSTTINMKEPQLECQYKELLLAISTDKTHLESAEQKLLEYLSTSTGNLLDNEELIETLKEAKRMANEVKERLKVAVKTREIISASRQKYERVAKRGSILFFSIMTLRNLNPVYVFSSDWFMGVFKNCINAIQLPESTQLDFFEAYLNRIVNHLLKVLYQRVSFGIFNKHCLPFAFKLCTMLLIHHDDSIRKPTRITKQEWMALMRRDTLIGETERSGSVLSLSSDKPFTVGGRRRRIRPRSISHEVWESAIVLDRSVQFFEGLLNHIADNEDMWVCFSNSENPWDFKFDQRRKSSLRAKEKKTDDEFVTSKISRFHRLLLVYTFCPHKFADTVKWFIETEIGLRYYQKHPSNLDTIYHHITTVNPALIIIGSNVDPTAQLTLLATEKDRTLNIVSLGQGQEERATNIVWASARDGHWVFLQNCHLALSWMPLLEQLIKDLQQALDTHKDFRMWLSTKSTNLPPTLLRSSVKVCLESPTSIKSNMQQLISLQGTAIISPDDFERREIVEWQQLVFKLCLFHSAANARRRYDSEGWMVPCVFGPNDIQVSIQLLHNILKGRYDEGGDDCGHEGGIPWDAVRQLVGDICYGGKLTDAQDMRTLRALLNKFCSPETISQGYDEKSESVTPNIHYSDVCKMLHSIPETDKPTVLGLTSMLQSTILKNESKYLHSTLRQMEMVEKFTSSDERDQDEYVLEKAQEILDKLPSPITSEHCNTAITSHSIKLEEMSPYWMLLSSEVVALNECLFMLEAALKGVVRGIKEVMPESIFQEIYVKLAQDTVPNSWKFGRDAPSLLSDWLNWFSQHYHFIEKWVSMNAAELSKANFKAPPKLPKKMWLPAFNYVNGLFEAIKQNHSRVQNIPVENITIRFDSASHYGKKSIANGVMISGMRVGLAEWDPNKGLIRTTKKQQYNPMPDIVCYPVENCSEGSTTPGHWFPCPLYASSEKKKFLCYITLKTFEQPDHLSLMGTTLIL